jgi:acetoin utilization protein AcuC
VLTISLHQQPMTLWPGTGWSREYGAGDGVGYAVNLPLPPGTSDPGWLRAFDAVVPSLLIAFRPQLLVTQCGADTHHEDPLADLGLSVDGHREIYRRLPGWPAGGWALARHRRRRGLSGWCRVLTLIATVLT